MLDNTKDIKHHLLPPATKLGQGNIFRSVCQEFCSRGGGSAPLPAGIHTPGPEAGTPHPRTRGRHPPPQDQRQAPFWTTGRHPCPGQTPPDQRQAPPGTVHAGRYEQQVGGTHPTGMQSCLFLFSEDKVCVHSGYDNSVVLTFKLEKRKESDDSDDAINDINYGQTDHLYEIVIDINREFYS